MQEAQSPVIAPSDGAVHLSIAWEILCNVWQEQRLRRDAVRGGRGSQAFPVLWGPRVPGYFGPLMSIVQINHLCPNRLLSL